MPEGDFTPRSYRPKALTKAQLREMQKRFEKASEKIDEIKILEKKHKDKNIDNPEWI